MTSIINKIDEIRESAPETANGLIKQLNMASCAEYLKEELEDMILGSDDYLESAGEIEEETQMWVDIRDIQHDIISSYSCPTCMEMDALDPMTD